MADCLLRSTISCGQNRELARMWSYCSNYSKPHRQLSLFRIYGRYRRRLNSSPRIFVIYKRTVSRADVDSSSEARSMLSEFLHSGAHMLSVRCSERFWSVGPASLSEFSLSQPQWRGRLHYDRSELWRRQSSGPPRRYGHQTLRICNRSWFNYWPLLVRTLDEGQLPRWKFARHQRKSENVCGTRRLLIEDDFTVDLILDASTCASK